MFKMTKIRTTIVYPMGNYRSLPAEVGISCPEAPKPSRPLEHPVEMTLSGGTPVKPLLPVNGSTLALERPRELKTEQAPA